MTGASASDGGKGKCVDELLHRMLKHYLHLPDGAKTPQRILRHYYLNYRNEIQVKATPTAKDT